MDCTRLKGPASVVCLEVVRSYQRLWKATIALYTQNSGFDLMPLTLNVSQARVGVSGD